MNTEVKEHQVTKISNGHQENGTQVHETIEETTFRATSSTTTTNGDTPTNGVKAEATDTAATTTNGQSSPTPASTPTIHIEEDLKIIEHLKSINQKSTDEQRQVFLNKIVNESSTTTTSTTSSAKTNNQTNQPSDATSKSSPGQVNGKDISRSFVNEKKLLIEEKEQKSFEESRSLRSPIGSPISQKTKTFITSPLTSPVGEARSFPLSGGKISPTPPPKPPMLSRTRSIGVGEQRLNGSAASTPSTPPVTPAAGLLPYWAPIPGSNDSTSPATTTTITSTTIPEPTKIETINIVESCEALDNLTESTSDPQSPVSMATTSMPTIASSTPTKKDDRSISAKHYEHLIEELKCPGCASPMKAPILLCETGHSVCEQCTRILMMCPLCKQPFTKQRSLTVEALSSKAHFRCTNAAGGCSVRLQKDLLTWHEKQCIYKPMKCFMGRVWGDCDWDGREIQWKEHIETDHANKVFKLDSIDLIWNMAAKQKPLNGYYVFQVYDEMFNFYEIHDKERILFTMTCTSSIREKKHRYAYEVTIMHPDNEALAVTQKFPVHSEYDKDILMEGTCVTCTMSDMAKFIDDEKLLHYRVRILPVNSPRRSKLVPAAEKSSSPAALPDFHNTEILGGNLKKVPSENIVTRKLYDFDVPSTGIPSSSEDEFERIRRDYMRRLEDGEDSESDPEFEAFVSKRWGTPQLHFNRKYLKTPSSGECSTNDSISPLREAEAKMNARDDDRSSVASTSYKKRMSNTLRKSFRTLKNEISEIKYFSKRSPDKLSPEKLSPEKLSPEKVSCEKPAFEKESPHKVSTEKLAIK